MKKFLYLFTALSLVFCSVLSGCSSNNTANMTTADILTKSYSSMQAAKSFHFAMVHDKSGTPISNDILMTKLTGDIVSPDKLQATIDGTYSSTAIEVKLVTVSGKTYMTNPISGLWEEAPDSFKVLSVFDPGTGVAAIIKGLTDAENLGNEKVGSSQCVHLKGDVLSETLQPLTGTSAKGVKVATEVWIDTKTFLVSQVKLTGKITDSETDGITRTLNFTNYNKNIDIELPKV